VISFTEEGRDFFLTFIVGDHRTLREGDVVCRNCGLELNRAVLLTRPIKDGEELFCDVCVLEFERISRFYVTKRRKQMDLIHRQLVREKGM
jgi:hypothetical protein